MNGLYSPLNGRDLHIIQYYSSKKNTKGSAVTTITLKGKCMIINRLKVGGWKKIYCVHS